MNKTIQEISDQLDEIYREHWSVSDWTEDEYGRIHYHYELDDDGQEKKHFLLAEAW